MTMQTTYSAKPWRSHYEPNVPYSLEYETITLSECLDRVAQRAPNHPALIFQGYTVTYQQLADMIDRFASCLNDFGIRKGDSVAIILPNLIPCVAAYYAIMKIGAITVMNNPLYSDRELKHQLNNSGAKVIVTLDLLANRMIALRPETQVQQIVVTSIGDYLPFPKNILFKLFGKKKKLAADVQPAPNVFKWKERIEASRPYQMKTDISFDDVAMYQYTGGTTGVSKGVILTHANLSKQAQQITAWFPTFKNDNVVMLSALPFFHVFGLSGAMNLSIYNGWSQVLVPKPQPDPLIEAIQKFKPTFAPLVPTMYIGILNHPKIDAIDMTSIKGCFSGSAPLPVEVIHDFEKKTGAVIVEGFGLTETTPVTHINPFNAEKRKVGSIGIPLPDTECRIVSLEDGVTDVPVGSEGELLIRGPQVMEGYWNMPDETANVLTQDGWLHTGDIAKMDEDGYFFIVDRKKDLIISGGYNVYPREIDEVFYEHPKIQEACTIGIPHPTRGESCKVFVVLKPNQTATTEELMEFCKGRLAKYKWPSEIVFRNDLPKTNVGKILRKELRKQDIPEANK